MRTIQVIYQDGVFRPVGWHALRLCEGRGPSIVTRRPRPSKTLGVPPDREGAGHIPANQTEGAFDDPVQSNIGATGDPST
jgi:hypothetical protein